MHRRSTSSGVQATAAVELETAYRNLIATCDAIVNDSRRGVDLGPEAWDDAESWRDHWIDLRRDSPQGELGDDMFRVVLAWVALVATGNVRYRSLLLDLDELAHLHDYARRLVSQTSDGHSLIACAVVGVFHGDVELTTTAIRSIVADHELVYTAWSLFADGTTHRRPAVHRDWPALRAAVEILSASRPLQRPWRPSPHLSPGQQWALLCSIQFPPIIDPLHELAVPRARGAVYKGLAEWLWEPGKAGGLLHWLYSTGRRGDVASALEQLDRGVHPDPESNSARFLRRHRSEFETTAVGAWDWCALIHDARLFVRAGLVDSQTAWKWIRAAAQNLRRAYTSWEHMAEGYVLGAQLSFSTSFANARTQVGFYLYDPRSPWHVVPWDIDPDLL